MKRRKKQPISLPLSFLPSFSPRLSSSRNETSYSTTLTPFQYIQFYSNPTLNFIQISSRGSDLSHHHNTTFKWRNPNTLVFQLANHHLLILLLPSSSPYSSLSLSFFSFSSLSESSLFPPLLTTSVDLTILPPLLGIRSIGNILFIY